MKVGFIRGVSAPTVFYHPVWDVRCVVHGDDLTFLGHDGDLDRVEKVMGLWYDVKVRGRL